MAIIKMDCKKLEEHCYYLCCEKLDDKTEICEDEDIANLLGISLSEYLEIILLNGAMKFDCCHNGYEITSKKDGKKIIKKLKFLFPLIVE